MLKNRDPYQVLGKDLNLLSQIDHLFEPNKHYVFCRYLYQKNSTGYKKTTKQESDQSKNIFE